MFNLRVTLLCVLVLSAPAWASPFSVDDWELKVTVLPLAGQMAEDTLDVVANPYVDAHDVQIDASSSAAAYDFSWDETSGRFDVGSLTEAEYGPDGVAASLCSGRIDVTPTADLRLHVDATMDYALPTEHMTTGMQLWAVHDADFLFLEERTYSTVESGIGSGTLLCDEDFVLPAGETWSLGYALDVWSVPGSGGAPGLIGTASMSLSYTFEVIPEPSTLMLVVLGGVAMLRRRRV